VLLFPHFYSASTLFTFRLLMFTFFFRIPNSSIHHILQLSSFSIFINEFKTIYEFYDIISFMNFSRYFSKSLCFYHNYVDKSLKTYIDACFVLTSNTTFELNAACYKYFLYFLILYFRTKTTTKRLINKQQKYWHIFSMHVNI